MCAINEAFQLMSSTPSICRGNECELRIFAIGEKIVKNIDKIISADIK